MSSSDLSRAAPPDFEPTANMAIALRQPYRLQTAIERQQEDQITDESLTLTDLLRIVLKHKWTLLTVIVLACLRLFAAAQSRIGRRLRDRR